MIIVTGGAGFIGSALVWQLNEQGETDIIIVDELDHDEKEHNVAPLKYEELIGIKDFREKLLAGDFNNKGVTGVVHLGACSDTTETDWEYLEDNNVEYSKDIIRWCADNGVRCVYASSAATYGNGEKGYNDDHKLFNTLTPLNLYGKSKLLVDIWARDGGYLENVAGLRYFNVFGPNEWHKEHMRSVIAKSFDGLHATGVMKLFKSYHPEYRDGEQQRDFVYVKDAIAATLWFLAHKDVNGIYNVGTAQAHTWNEVAHAMFSAIGKPPRIEYIEMPDNLKNQYQYFTQADVAKLRAAGYQQAAIPLNQSIADYIRNYLQPHTHLGD